MLIEYDIANTGYCVKTSAQIAEVGMMQGTMRCWKVSVSCDDMKKSYDINTLRAWDLTALLIKENWDAILEVRLQRKRG